MVLTSLRRAGGFILAVAGVGVWLWGIWPARQISQAIPYQWEEGIQLPSGWEEVVAPPALENGIFTLRWPSMIRLGDEGKIRLELAATDSGSPCSEQENSTEFVLKSRLELTGARVAPGDELTQPVVPCQVLFQAWTLRPMTSEPLDGTIWLHLETTVSKNGNSPGRPIAALPVTITPTSLVGLTGSQARLVGILAVLIGLILNIDLLVRRK
jgi:hypothetical protein